MKHRVPLELIEMAILANTARPSKDEMLRMKAPFIRKVQTSEATEGGLKVGTMLFVSIAKENKYSMAQICDYLGLETDEEYYLALREYKEKKDCSHIDIGTKDAPKIINRINNKVKLINNYISHKQK